MTDANDVAEINRILSQDSIVWGAASGDRKTNILQAIILRIQDKAGVTYSEPQIELKLRKKFRCALLIITESQINH